MFKESIVIIFWGTTMIALKQLLKIIMALVIISVPVQPVFAVSVNFTYDDADRLKFRV